MDLKIRLAQDALVSAQAIQSKHVNKKCRDVKQDLVVGDLVLLNTEHIDLSNIPDSSIKKLQDRFVGPFSIVKIISKTTYKLELPSNWKLHPVFHISKLKKHIDDIELFESRKASRPSPEIIDAFEEYEVECIVDKRVRYKKLQYLVKWKGYPEYENTWEPINNLSNAQEAVKAYELVK